MNFEDRGKYITVLSQMHQQGRMLEEAIRFLIGDISESLKSKFKIDKNGKWYNSRLEEETEKRRSFVNSRRKNGKLGGRPKKPTGKPTGKASDNLTEDENENANDNDIKDEKHKYGEYFHVLLTDAEKEKLVDRLTETGFNEWVKKLDEGIELKGYKYKNHYLAILKWFNKDGKKAVEKLKQDKELEEWINE